MISANNAVGGISGANANSKVENCYNTGTIQGYQNTGGICGNTNSNATIENCYNTGTIKSNGNQLGGISGISTNSQIYSCYNTGTIINEENSESVYNIGGIVGYCGNISTIKYCYNLGIVKNETTRDSVGGIVGRLVSADSETILKIENCYNYSNIEPNGNCTGGICGQQYSYCSIINCFVSNKKMVTGKSSNIANKLEGTSANNYTGQIVGYAQDSKNLTGNDILEDMPSVYSILTQYIEKDDNGNVIPSPWIEDSDGQPKLKDLKN